MEAPFSPVGSWSVACVSKRHVKVTERDNNYSVTTSQLAEAIQRSAGAAAAYGNFNAA